jgi:hypothetical protein
MQTLQNLYDSIPKFTCTPGCNLCCGPTPCNTIEQQVLNIQQPITPTNPFNNTCLFSTPQGCSQYKNRPLMCRLYGTVEMLSCPAGNRPKLMLTRKQEKKLMQRYKLLSVELKTSEANGMFLTTIKQHLK